MAIYLLKFSACLFILWLFYYLLLEKESRHSFKRVYLLGALAISLFVPASSIIEYTEPTSTFIEINSLSYLKNDNFQTELTQARPIFWTTERLLWLIYSLGVLLFAVRFTMNLHAMLQRINKNEKLIQNSLIYVLLKDYKTPHSFFKFIFLNKYKFDEKEIPEEVILHEEAHAKQLHSLDIILIELFQIVFWFHPLIYVLKHHVKLNHEFLADQAVLNSGTNTKSYQNVLLKFSTNINEYHLSSGINYTSIKKRFTVMKTQTSKSRTWLSSLLILPLVGILFYSFAEREYVVEKSIATSGAQIPSNTIKEDNSTQEQAVIAYRAKAQKYTDAIEMYIKGAQTDNSELLILEAEARSLYEKFSQAELNKYNLLQTPPVPATYLTPKNLKQEGVTAKQLAEYNAWAKNLNESEHKIFRVEELNKYQAIFEAITAKQRKNAEAFPKIPPPPLPPPAPDSPEPLRTDKVSKKLPAPPPPKSGYEFVKDLKNKDITYYFNKKEISYNEILKITKDRPNIIMQYSIKNNQGFVKFWDKE